MEQISKMELDINDDSNTIIECKKCQNTFQSTSILRHLRRDACKQAYTEQELNNLRTEAKDRANAKRRNWKEENKEHVKAKAADYCAENREKKSNQNSDYYKAHKDEISVQKAQKYQESKDDIELQWRHWNWLHSGPDYYRKKWFALAQYDKFIWNENGKWHTDIKRFKNSKLITKEIAIRLDNLKAELNSKMNDLHNIAIKEVKDIEKELGIPEERKFENYLNDQEFQSNIFVHLREYLCFKRKHIYYFAQDQLKEIANSLKETLDPWIKEHWVENNKQREIIIRKANIHEEEQLRLNEEYFNEVRDKMFEIHRNDVENHRSVAESYNDYSKLRKPPAFQSMRPFVM